MEQKPKKIKPMVRLSQSQIDSKKEFIRQYIEAENASSGSTVDSNANVSVKTVATLGAELNKDIAIQVNRSVMCDYIEKYFDRETAEEYVRLLEEHTIYKHDETSVAPMMPYCTSINMYPFLESGMTKLGGESTAPKHLESFCGSFINLIFAISSQFAGAVASVEFPYYFHYFATKDYGKDYLKTNPDMVRAKLQHVVYSINQPAASRGYQSTFWNISVFDKYFFESMFGNFYFPDGTHLDYEGFNEFQKFFMEFLLEERKKTLLTFPVLTEASLDEDGFPKDEEWADFCADIRSRGLSFFSYNSESVDALASCCFDGKETVLINNDGVRLISFEELYNECDDKEKFVYHNGSWNKGNVIRLPKRPMYEITTTNNKKIVVTDNHINVTDSGNKESWQLTTDDYLMFSNIPLQEHNKNDLTYNHGYVIGAFLGNGSFGTRHKSGVIYDINFSMNERNYEKLYNCLYEVSDGSQPHLNEVYNKVYPVRISNKDLVAFIQRFICWEEGMKAHNKKLNLDCLLESVEFRQGILDGWYDTDGGNSNRCYTTSKELAESMEVLITSLGMHSVINVSDRTNEPCIIREVEYKRNYPLYCVRWYSPNGKRSMKGVYKVVNNSMFFRIKSIEKVEATSDFVYCFEMEDKNEPYFTLPNGIITHNCRLRNAVENTDFSYSLGAGGIETGSHSVITLDLVALFGRGYDLEDIIKKVHKFQYAHRMMVQDGIDAGLLPAYSAGFIHLDKQFSTLGVNGLNEAAEEQGLTVGNNKEYKEWVSNVLGTFKRLNMEARSLYNGAKYNTELVPAENLGVKNAKWDKKAGLYHGTRECYNSYMYLSESDVTSIPDKFELHGSPISDNLDGGSAYHLNLSRLPDKEFFLWLRKLAAKYKCNYWTTNVKGTVCNDCNHHDMDTFEECPKCGSKNLDYHTRVIGYCKKISAFSGDRKKEESLRYYH